MGRKRLRKSRPKHSLPEDLCREMLSLLPVKSLLRFRSVCKSWRTLIADPGFVRYHLARFSNNRHESHLFAVQYGPDRSRECALRRNRDFRITARLGSFGAEENTIVGSIDGLFMLKQNFNPVAGDIQYQFVLWNPSIRKTLIVNPSPALCNAEEFGLGFDPSVKDYKYVRIGHNFTAVYTVGSKSWRTIQQRGSYHGELGRTVCFRGHLLAPARYMIGMKRSMDLLLFDLQIEAYATMRWPEDTDFIDRYRADGLTLADGGRSLQLISLSNRKCSVWALEGSLGRDVKSWSWVQRHTFVLTIGLEIPIGYVCWGDRFLEMNQNGVIMFRAYAKVISFNIETQEEKHKKNHVFHAWPYKESLILH